MEHYFLLTSDKCIVFDVEKLLISVSVSRICMYVCIDQFVPSLATSLQFYKSIFR